MSSQLEARYRRILNLLPVHDRASLGTIVVGDLMESHVAGQTWPTIVETISLLRLIGARWNTALELPSPTQRRHVTQVLSAYVPALLTIPVTMAIAVLGLCIGQLAAIHEASFLIAGIRDGRIWVDSAFWLLAAIVTTLWLVRSITAARIMTGILLVSAIIAAGNAWNTYSNGLVPDPRMALSPFAFWILPVLLGVGFLTFRPDMYTRGCNLVQPRNRRLALALCLITTVGALILTDHRVHQTENTAIAIAGFGLLLLSTNSLGRRLVLTVASTLICIGIALRPLTHGISEILIDHQLDAVLLAGTPLLLAPFVYLITGSLLRPGRTHANSR